MLNKSLILSAGRQQGVASKLRSNILTEGHFTVLQARPKHLSSNRYVTTTTPSKTHQIAPQRKEVDNEEILSDPTGLSNSEKYQTRLKHLSLWHSIETIKKLGHRLVALDPLQMKQPESLKDLSWSYTLLEQLKSNQDIIPAKAFLDTNQPVMAINELIDTVWSIYTGTECGIEFDHLSNQAEAEWLMSQWEKLNEIFHLDKLEEQNLAKLLLECETFDHFMATKFPTTKRYGCEGVESMLVIFDEILRSCHLGKADCDDITKSIGRIDDVIIGMPHRGRLNLLACLLHFEPQAIFNKTNGEPELETRSAWMAKGDVLSHLSTNVRFDYGLDRHHIGLWRSTPDPINVTLLPNPSHLEVVSPMVTGTARGRAHNIFHGYSSSPKFAIFNKKINEENIKEDYPQYFKTILPIQVHGDASIAGQGIIQETLQMANIPKFTVGGSIHIIVNNQIGYTTDSSLGRSTRHCTDVFKMIEAPIIHVNAQNIASVVRATRLALTYRQKFGKDVAIDLIGYRKHGHNEMDEPSFTQPAMYSKIKQRKSIPQVFCDQIGLEEDQRDHIVEEYKSKLQDSYKKMDSYKPDNDNYRNFCLPTDYHRDHICQWQTGCDLGTLKSIALASVETPRNFNIHPNLKRVLVADRQLKFSEHDNEKIEVDWATAEILAFGSLLKENNSVRLAGQDVARGTFSTRHAVLYDQNTNEPFTPLNHMMGEATPKSRIEVANTILSEEASLAYEFAYSVETTALTIWEAQFGDFFNTAQSVIDTLVSSSESKWLKQSALTLLLPHGLDGAGPEHSSSRIERFLQLSSSSSNSIDTEAKVNWSICYPTLPKQYFHLLRRQMMRPFRKPLVVMSPKVIFRHPECVSPFTDFGQEGVFEPVLDDPHVIDHQAVDTVVFCTGKVYFMLNEQRLQNRLNNVTLVRIEELCPFPIPSLVDIIKMYPNVKPGRYFWFQEEHKNQGAYSFVDQRFRNIVGIPLNYIGRPESDLPAIGCTSMHKKEVEKLQKEFRALKRS